MTPVETLTSKEAELQQSVTSLTSTLPVEIVSDDQRVEAIAVCRKIKGKIEEVNAKIHGQSQVYHWRGWWT